MVSVFRGTAIAAAGAAALTVGAALADNAPLVDDFSKYSDPTGVVLAVKTEFNAVGGAVRLSVYDEGAFLEQAAMKQNGVVNEDGLALVPIRGLRPGAYAFVAYYDENGDGKLNRGALGQPKEPIAFSNGVRPKLRKPRFEEAKVDVAPGAVVVLTLDD
ncbi:MAG: DUF2141 domain-containing protein [Parvularculaceae bacterium]